MAEISIYVIKMLEIRRKVAHILFGTVFMILFYFLGTIQILALSIATLFVGLIYSFKIFRGHKSKLNFFLSKLSRDSEQGIPGKGAVLFLLGLIILLLLDLFLLQSRRIVFASLAIIVFADSFSTIVGAKIGKWKFSNNKTAEGTLTFFLTSLLFLSVLYPLHLLLVVITALITSLVEMLPFNDNLLVPQASALCIYLLLIFL